MGNKMMSPKSILVYVGLDLTGDAVMKLPFIYTLRKTFPDATITWCAGKGDTAFEGPQKAFVNGFLDEVISNVGIGKTRKEFLKPCPLKDRYFDLVIDTQSRIVTTLLVRRIPHKYFVSLTIGFLMSILRPSTHKMPRSLALQLHSLIEKATGRPVKMEVQGPVMLDEDSQAEKLLPYDGDKASKYIGFAPGAGMVKKCWPLDRYLDVAANLEARGFRPVFFLGPQEKELIDIVKNKLPNALLPLQQVETMKPELTVALGRRLVACVSNDCGAAHLLALSGVPLISLFGPTSAEKFAPSVVRGQVIKAQDWGSSEMASIPTDAVLQAMDAMICEAV